MFTNTTSTFINTKCLFRKKERKVSLKICDITNIWYYHFSQEVASFFFFWWWNTNEVYASCFAATANMNKMYNIFFLVPAFKQVHFVFLLVLPVS